MKNAVKRNFDAHVLGRPIRQKRYPKILAIIPAIL